MFLASIGIVFAGTMAAVLIAHDGISRDRASGVLELRLSQPMPRWRQGVVLMVGHWSSIALPVAVLLIASMLAQRAIRDVNLVGSVRYMWVLLWLLPIQIFCTIGLFGKWPFECDASRLTSGT